MSDVDLKLKIQAQNTATPALTELLNSIKALIEQARILNTLLNLHINVNNSGSNLGADLRALELQAQQLQNHLNLQINAQNNAGGALNSATRSTQQLGTAAHGAAEGVRSLEQHAEILQTRLNQFIALQVAQVVSGWGQSLVHTAEAYQTNSAKLHLAIKDTQEFNAVHQILFDVAQRSRGSLDQTANAFVRNSESIKRMGGTTDQAILATELLNKAIASTSIGAAQDASALMQWNQALGKGILNGDELNSIMENSLGLTKAIADGMGIPIGKLKELGEAGKLTGTDLVNALFNNRQAIEENFNAVPITVSQSLTLVENAFQQYVGQANEARGTTQTVAKGFIALSKNIPEMVEGLLALAAIYGVKLTSSLAGYIAKMQIQSAAQIEAIAEGERLNYVRIQELQTQQAVAAASVTAARATLAEARLNAALATTVADRTVANEALALSIGQVTAAEEGYIAATATLGAATETATVKLTAMEMVTNGLKTAFSLLFAAWAGWEVGTMLRKFESVRMAGSLLTEGWVIQIAAAKHFFSGAFLTSKQGLVDKIKAIHKDFAGSRAFESEAAQQAAEQSKQRHETEIALVEAEKIAKQAAFKEVQAQLKEAGAAMDAEDARQLAATKAALAQRSADIAAMSGTVMEKELLLVQVVKAANEAQAFIIKETARKKLKLIDDVYVAELKTLKEGTVEQIAVERDSLLARREVYQSLEKSYGAAIDSMIAEEQKLIKEAKTLADQRRGIEQSYADFKAGLDDIGEGNYKKITNEKQRLDKLVAEQKTALANGDAETVERLNARILELGKDLAIKQKTLMEEGEKAITDARSKGLDKRHELYTQVSQSDIDATLRITDQAQAAIVGVNEKAQQSNKARFADVQESAKQAKGELASVQTELENITQTLQKKFSFKIAPDTGAVDEAIARISKDTHSTHTINVVETRSQATEKRATGGYITGKGTGTSDEIPAMLSNGEYVITADKVKQHGVAAFDAINYGNVSPSNYYASGGVVGGDKLSQKIAELKKAEFDKVAAFFDLPMTQWNWSQGGTLQPLSEDAKRLNFQLAADKYLRDNGLPLDFLPHYMSRLALAKKTNTGSIDERAKAQLALEDTNAIASTTPTPAPTTSTPVPRITSAQPPVVNLPRITPTGFNPHISSNGSATQSITGKTSTIKFVAPNGKTETGRFSGETAGDFFTQLDTLSGVTKL